MSEKGNIILCLVILLFVVAAYAYLKGISVMWAGVSLP